MLVLALVMSSIPAVTIKAASNTDVDIYMEGLRETIIIDGIEYAYHYYYDSNGNRAIEVRNGYNGGIDVVSCDSDDGIIYMNDEVLGTFRVDENLYNQDECLMNNDDVLWIYMGSTKVYISWGQGVLLGAVAAAITAALGFLTGGVGVVIAAMGTSALSVLAASAVGGTVYYTTYKFNSTLLTQFRYDWSFKASTGDKYGPYIYLTQMT